jgi:hypothetical protein
MNQQKLTIRFVIVKAKINKRGLCPLSCRLTLKGKRKVFSTGQLVSPKYWNPKQQYLFKTDDSLLVNSHLELICTKIKKAYLSLIFKRFALYSRGCVSKVYWRTNKKVHVCCSVF